MPPKKSGDSQPAKQEATLSRFLIKKSDLSASSSTPAKQASLSRDNSGISEPSSSQPSLMSSQGAPPPSIAAGGTGAAADGGRRPRPKPVAVKASQPISSTEQTSTRPRPRPVAVPPPSVSVVATAVPTKRGGLSRTSSKAMLKASIAARMKQNASVAARGGGGGSGSVATKKGHKRNGSFDDTPSNGSSRDSSIVEFDISGKGLKQPRLTRDRSKESAISIRSSSRSPSPVMTESAARADAELQRMLKARSKASGPTSLNFGRIEQQFKEGQLLSSDPTSIMSGNEDGFLTDHMLADADDINGNIGGSNSNSNSDGISLSQRQVFARVLADTASMGMRIELHCKFFELNQQPLSIQLIPAMFLRGVDSKDTFSTQLQERFGDNTVNKAVKSVQSFNAYCKTLERFFVQEGGISRRLRRGWKLTRSVAHWLWRLASRHPNLRINCLAGEALRFALAFNPVAYDPCSLEKPLWSITAPSLNEVFKCWGVPQNVYEEGYSMKSTSNKQMASQPSNDTPYDPRCISFSPVRLQVVMQLLAASASFIPIGEYTTAVPGIITLCARILMDNDAQLAHTQVQHAISMLLDNVPDDLWMRVYRGILTDLADLAFNNPNYQLELLCRMPLLNTRAMRVVRMLATYWAMDMCCKMGAEPVPSTTSLSRSNSASGSSRSATPLASAVNPIALDDDPPVGRSGLSITPRDIAKLWPELSTMLTDIKIFEDGNKLRSKRVSILAGLLHFALLGDIEMTTSKKIIEKMVESIRSINMRIVDTTAGHQGRSRIKAVLQMIDHRLVYTLNIKFGDQRSYD
ncbi:hypothetical protein GQ42DRAFT_177359 [Ramicandelaber brevisporus]|nr:hypothetical protein GQ42DRAFT_177359 [Ramicandelaber brevisporus]